MSDPNPANDLLDPLLRHVADRITPLFETASTDKAEARTTAISALAAYNPSSRADIVTIARILAFSLASLAALGLAAAHELPVAQKMQYFGRANALNRSANQTEGIMLRRRDDRRAKPLPPVAAAPAPRPADPSTDYAAIDAALKEAMTRYRAAMKPAVTAKSGSLTTQKQPLAAPASASLPSQRPATPYRQALLNGSAIPRLIGGVGPQPAPS